ncbi:hypothetical protein [Streptomyces sp. NPDC021622]|uniref:hypothetical protein n=1 Tax=Streptomyces sp. NPDC021622 TaxID=3155013 RepID=UPI00340BAFBA
MTLALTGCGTQTGPSARDEASPETSAATKQSATPSPEREPSDGTTLGQDEKLVQEKLKERARNAATGDPVGPKNTKIPRPQDYGFGAAVATAQDGEVIAYAPRLDGGQVVVPLTIENLGSQRAAYTVKVIAEGKGASSDVIVTVKAPYVFPHTTWPTQADVTAAGTEHVKDLKVTLKVTKKNLV